MSKWRQFNIFMIGASVGSATQLAWMIWVVPLIT